MNKNLTGSSPNVNSTGDVIEKSHPSSERTTTNYGELIVEKIHGIGGKLLGHHRSDSDCSTRGKTGIPSVRICKHLEQFLHFRYCPSDANSHSDFLFMS